MALNTAASLRQPLIDREIFNPTDERHLASLDVFLRTGNWGDVQFYSELPFVEVPATVLTKYAMHQRSLVAETAQERAVRFAAKNLVTPLPRETKEQKAERLKVASARVLEDVQRIA